MNGSLPPRREKPIDLGKLITVPEPEPSNKKYKVHWWDQTWVWLNGKKTKIGLYVAGAGALSVCVGMIIFPPLIPLGKAIGYIGTATFGGGLVHKFFKGKIKYSNGEAKELGQLITETLTVFYGWIQFITHLKKKGGE